MGRFTAAAALLLVALPLAAQSQEPQQPAAAASEKAETRGKVRAACQADIQKLCANVERAKGAMRACLEANQKDLSAACNAARAERAAARAKEKS